MATRKEIYYKMKKFETVRFMIDPRMGAEHASLFTVPNGDEENVKLYEPTLVPDSSIENEPCTAKATTYTAMMLGGLVAQSVRDCLLGKNTRVIHWSIKDYEFMMLR